MYALRKIILMKVFSLSDRLEPRFSAQVLIHDSLFNFACRFQCCKVCGHTNAFKECWWLLSTAKSTAYMIGANIVSYVSQKPSPCILAYLTGLLRRESNHYIAQCAPR